MKPMRSFLVLFVSLAFAAGLSAQTITGYGVVKNHYVTQTSSSAPVDDVFSPYGVSAYVSGSSLAGTYSFTSPGGSATSPQVISTTGSGGNFQSATSYLTTTALNLGYNDGVYSMAMPNINGAPQTANLPSFSGDLYPTTPMITSGTWSGGMLLVDPTLNYTLNFAAFVSPTINDSIGLGIQGIGSFFPSTAATSFVISAGTLTAGVTYDVSLRFNHNFIDYGVAIALANGNSGYTTENYFQIQAIPEPSTYAAILGVAALGGVMIRRRLTLRAS
ncbi:MAG: PEP-CTERM sorting domain-containing protein [Lacunisphaera sp.]|nr:PEP-CTERM sorting domain-containing protein [Lacunisphaera sp.]